MSKWNKGLMVALENENEIVETDEQSESNNEDQMKEFADRVDQTQDAMEVTEILTDDDKTDSEKLEAVTEHFKQKLGLDQGYSLESIHNPDNSKLQDLLSVSQEGFFQRFGHGIKKMFTSNDTLIKDLIQAQESIVGKTQKLDPIKEPGWGRVFNSTAKKIIDAHDVEKSIKNLVTILNGSDFNKAVEDSIKVLDKTATAINKSWFIANDRAVQEIRDLIEDATDAADHVLKNLDKPRVLSYDPDYKPITAQETAKLTKMIMDILDNTKLESKMKAFDEAITRYNLLVIGNLQTRLIKHLAADMRAAQSLVSKLNPALMTIYDIYKLRKSMSYSLREYIKASFR